MIAGLLSGTIAQADHRFPSDRRHDHNDHHHDHHKDERSCENSGYSTTTKIVAGTAGTIVAGGLIYWIYKNWKK